VGFNHNFQNILLASFKDYFILVEYFDHFMSFDIMEDKNQEKYT
jgi:hypothetical protein